MKINGQEYNFDRIVRLTVYPASSKNSNAAAKPIIIEYAPREDERLCPRIEAEVKDIPLQNKINNTSGYTGKITLYNPPVQLRSLIAKTMSTLVSYAWSKSGFMRDLQTPDKSTDFINEYYSKRLRAKLEVGYWKPEAEGSARKPYRTLIDGYLNSSVYYHKGTDDIMEFTIHDFQATQQEVTSIAENYGITCPTDITPTQKEIWSKEEAQARSGLHVPNWDTMLRKLVANFTPYRPNPYKNKPTSAEYWLTQGEMFIPVTEADKQNYGSWINVIYLKTRGNREDINIQLKVQLQDERIHSVRDFYASGLSLESMINELASWDGLHLGWEIDDFYTEGAITVFVWPLGNELVVTKGEDAEVKIINYQNLLETPAVSTSGALTIRMLLNLDAQPGKRIALILDDRYGSDTGTGNDLVIRPRIMQDGTGYERESLSFAGTPSPYTSTISGAHGQSAYALAVTKGGQEFMGYLFNTGFGINEATHRISTHTNTWETTVKTRPDYGGTYIIPDGKLRATPQRIGDSNDSD